MTEGAVAAGHAGTAEAGAAILRDGGNAVDALVGAGLAACVCEPLLTGLGGGGVVTVRLPDGAVHVLEFMSDQPGRGSGLSPREFLPIDIDYGPSTQRFHGGRGAAAVPGVAVGLCELHERYGRMALRRVAAEAVRLAETGWIASEATEAVFRMLDRIALASTDARALFAPERSPRRGDVLRNPQLADTMRALGEGGAAPFVSGGYGRALLEAFGPPHGSLSPADLSGYRAVWTEPIAIPVPGGTLYCPPPPCAGGLLLALGLSVLRSLPLHDEVAELTALTAVLAELDEARGEYVDAHLFEVDVVPRTLAPENIARHVASASRRVAAMGHPGAPGSGFGGPGNTTHVSTVDADGGAASYTSSLGETCGTLWPGAGMAMNNFLGEEDINPLGFHRGPPGQRLRTMMTPSILGLEDGTVVAFGTGGANRIRSAMLQATAHLSVHRRPLRAAIEAPRIHVEQGRLSHEAGFPEAALHAASRLARTVTAFDGRHLFFGGVHAAARHGDGRFEAIGDARRNGAGEVVGPKRAPAAASEPEPR